MTTEVHEYLAAVPFEPFYIVSTGGKRYPVPSADHASMNPRRNRVVVWFDNGGSVTMSTLHIAGIEKESGGENGLD